ncbi:YdcF family protein [Paenibacillus farraposensis]|uniref:YdcF family protein n=1 Tax=Paenibacillus farraposensis TaxID=2807095 RepID=A0ABW4DDC7_9BACL|nr:YdcF family protein [Paenibacillus farraposensis]MCC3381029.1 YdcF family protein [Paenibacillus farraposensis]
MNVLQRIGNIGPKRPQSQKRPSPAGKRFVIPKRLTLCLLIVFLTGLVWSGIRVWNMNTAASTTPLRPAQIGIVLGASMWGAEPSPGLKERLEEALRLYRNGTVKRLIVSGGLDKPDFPYTEAEGMQRYLIDRGIPAQHIILENQATSTYENLLYSQQIMKEHGWTSSIIITHSYHGPRALEIAQFLDFDHPQMALTESNVLNMPLHQSREILAYAKWTLQRWWISAQIAVT